MGYYVNPGSRKLKMSLNSEIYVDKSGLLTQTNKLLDTEKRFICLTRPRRFGKTMGANLMATYYGCGEDTRELFENLAIAKDATFEQHLNKYNVLMINMQEFLSQTTSITEMLALLQTTIIEELIEDYPDVRYKNKEAFIPVMKDVHKGTNRPFVILIDEWDCLFREYKEDVEAQKKYLDFLRLWLKDQAYVGLAYITGILPIKKYGSHSALNVFSEYSMIDPRQFLGYFGFNDEEMKSLTAEYGVDFDEMRKWYNGYFMDLGRPIYNPKSVTESLISKHFSNYWSNTETFEALRNYIMMDFDGLREKVTLMLAGEAVSVDMRSFTNDMTTFRDANDVMALLVHLGYLTYNFEKRIVRIPNEEVKDEFVTSVRTLKWDNVMSAIKQSNKLLQAIWNQETEVVAAGVEKVHEENTSILQYNDENSLSCVISLALYGATEYYTTIRELPTGKGYADLVFIPRKKHADKPALLVELKWDKEAVSAIDQIKQKTYITALDEYHDNLLLVGINYDKNSKEHTCMIEEYKA